MFCKNCEEYVEGDYSHSEAHFSLSLHTWMNNEHLKLQWRSSSYLFQTERPDRLPGDPRPELPRQREDRRHQPRHPPHRRPVLLEDVQGTAYSEHASITVVIQYTFIWNKYKSCSAMSALLRLGLLARRVIYWRNSTTNITFCQMTPWRLQKQGSTKA